jgi:hypothetical protein
MSTTRRCPFEREMLLSFVHFSAVGSLTAERAALERQAEQQRLNSGAAASASASGASASATRGPSAAAVSAASDRVPARRRAPPRTGLIAADPEPDVVDLISSDDDCEPPRSSGATQLSKRTVTAPDEHAVDVNKTPQPQRQQHLPRLAGSRVIGWVCSQCTLVNDQEAGHCEACSKIRPLGRLLLTATIAAPVAPGAASSSTGPPAAADHNRTRGPHAGWQCKFCTLCNDAGATRCGACGEWRYASGARMVPLGS